MNTNTDANSRTLTAGELIGDAFKVVPCSCNKCGLATTAFIAWQHFALCDRCDAVALADRRAVIESDARGYRAKAWHDRNMPLSDTDLALIPTKADKTAKVLAWQYCRKGLVIHGATGLGKTRVVLKLLHRLYVQDGHDFRFIRAPEWVHTIEAASYSQHRSFVTDLFYAPVVVLDDVGKEKPSERGLSALFDVIDYRTNHGLPVILTSNYNGEKLQKRFAERDAETSAAILRRIREFCTPVVFLPNEPTA